MKTGNFVSLIGRFGQDPELRTVGETYVANFSLARNRDYAPKDGEKETDWIECTAWGKLAETISKYLHKGDRIGITGSLQTRTYQNNAGVKIKSTFVNVESIEFLDAAHSSDGNSNTSSVPTASAPARKTTPSVDVEADPFGEDDMPF
jgi:single-strand DNA-binding protein